MVGKQAGNGVKAEGKEILEPLAARLVFEFNPSGPNPGIGGE